MTPQLRLAKKLSILMDSKFQGPFGIRFGLDALLGLIPLVGDLLTTLISLFIIGLAAWSGCPIIVVVRMVINVLIENAVSLLPVLGNLFDFVWKANLKNVELFERAEASPDQLQRQTWIYFGFAFGLAAALMLGFVWVCIELSLLIFQWLQNSLL